MKKAWPDDKVSVVHGILDGRWTRQEAADHYGVSNGEIEAWVRGYVRARKRGWTGLPSQRVTGVW